jgi:hypothetical protein
MIYDKDTGPTDYNGRVIQEGDYIVAGSNSRIRAGKVIAVKSHAVHYGGFVYAITIDKGDVPEGERRIQSFDHDRLGADKFWVVTHLED